MQSRLNAFETRDVVRCPQCRGSAQVRVEMLSLGAGGSRRSATFSCTPRCTITADHALRLADPMAC